MRVLHVQKAAGIGGSERHLLSLLPRLNEAGIATRLLVIVASGGEAFCQAARHLGIDVVTHPARSDVDPRLVMAIRRAFRDQQADLLHTHLIHADTHGQLAATSMRTPGVSSVHSAHGWYSQEPYRSAARMAGHLAKRVIAISHHVKETLVSNRIAPSDRIEVIHYGVDPEDWQVADGGDQHEARRRVGVWEEGLVVGMASRLISGKGHRTAIQAISRTRSAGCEVHLAVAGSGLLEAELRQLADQQLPPDTARFLGFVDDVEDFMAACDIILFPTSPELGEGFGLAALEAMAAARPVVATAIASLPELVMDGETGILVEPDDPIQLSDALVRLGTDPELRQRMGAAAAERAQAEFHIDRMVDRTLTLYDTVLGESLDT